MFKTLKLTKLLRRQLEHCTKSSPRCLCSNPSTPPIPPAPPKSKMPTELTTASKIQTKEQAKTQLATKEDMQWRKPFTPWHETEGKYYTALRAFSDDNNTAPFRRWLQQPIDLSPTAIKSWWARRKENEEIALQEYLPERNQMLGNELAAAHFLVYRDAAVKFFGDEKWIKKDDLGDYKLPDRFKEDMYLQAIDCTEMKLRYEGLSNLKNLKQLEWLSLYDCDKLDDWALDRIANIFSHSLLYLDIREMPLITYRGVGALCKLEQLKILYVDEMFGVPEFEMTCLMLQEINPSLDVRFNE